MTMAMATHALLASAAARGVGLRAIARRGRWKRIAGDGTTARRCSGRHVATAAAAAPVGVEVEQALTLLSGKSIQVGSLF